MQEARYRTRGHLPHLDAPETTQFLTWRLEDSIPPSAWREVLDDTAVLPEGDQRRERARRAEGLLDQGLGSAFLRHPLVARAVQESLLHGNGRRYRLHAFVVMPTHVHALLTPMASVDLQTIMRTIKSYTAHEANRILNRAGRFWQVEYFDRVMRSADHMQRTLTYIEWNPVKARLVSDPAHFAYSSAYPENAERLRTS